MKKSAFLLFVAWWAVSVSAAEPPSFQRPVHTYSIVARDPETGQMGAAVQSHWFSVGPIVPWAEAGVGAVATQSLVDVTYGPLALELLRAGRTASEALEALKVADSHPEVRQVAIVDANGNVAAHTGDKCIPDAGHLTGDNFSVQANLMLNDRVWPAMKEAYEKTGGELADKMLAALAAAEKAGGDIRGRQSAAILIVAAESSGKPWQDRLMDLRVEDHPAPVEELQRLVQLHRAYEHMNRGDLALEKKDTATALKEYAAAERLAPQNLEMKFWHAVSLTNIGEVDQALPIFRNVFMVDRNWATLVPRLRGVDLLPDKDDTIARILSVAPPDAHSPGQQK
jgi:uncharacterized Ntn-hydrolase superfamily protein